MDITQPLMTVPGTAVGKSVVFPEQYFDLLIPSGSRFVSVYRSDRYAIKIR